MCYHGPLMLAWGGDAHPQAWIACLLQIRSLLWLFLLHHLQPRSRHRQTIIIS